MTALLYVMAAMRNPETGCPWDCEQNFASTATYTVEEAYEVMNAIKKMIGRYCKTNLAICASGRISRKDRATTQLV